MKVCITCKINKKNKEFRIRQDNSSLRNECKSCESKKARERYLTSVDSGDKVSLPKEPETERDIRNPEEAKEIAMKRMLSGAKNRAKQQGLMFNLNYADIKVPNLCPVLKIPLIPSDGEGLTDNSPSLDKRVPHLGYVKGNVTVISMLANRIKTNATAAQILEVAKYTNEIEKENT